MPSAKRVFGGDCIGSSEKPCFPVYVSFDINNKMVMSSCSYGNPQYKRAWVYLDPLNKQTPDMPIPFEFGQAGASQFDPYGNLVFQDHTWNRIIVFEAPFGKIFVNKTRNNLILNNTMSNDTTIQNNQTINSVENNSISQISATNFNNSNQESLDNKNKIREREFIIGILMIIIIIVVAERRIGRVRISLNRS